LADELALFDFAQCLDRLGDMLGVAGVSGAQQQRLLIGPG